MVASSKPTNIRDTRKLLRHVSLLLPNATIDTIALIDSGSDETLIDSTLVESHQIPTSALPAPVAMILADGTVASSGTVTHITNTVSLLIDGVSSSCRFYVTTLSYPIILGMDWLERHNPAIDWVEKTIHFPDALELELPLDETAPLLLSDMEVASMDKLSTTVYPFMSPDLCGSSTGLPTSLLERFHSLFVDDPSHPLPPHSMFDFPIDLQPDFTPATGKIYSLSIPERTALRTYIDDALAKGQIRPSRSPYAAPCFFVKKKDGSLRPVQDYRALNAGTVKMRHPLPLIADLFHSLRGARVFTTLDLRGAYNLLRIRPGDEWKTAFVCPIGQFEYTVLPFGLANAPSHFQWVMSTILRPLLGKTVQVYLDDIIIYSQDPDDHMQHVAEVLEILLEYNLLCKSEKCLYKQPSLQFLGHIISETGVSMDPAKVSSVWDWPIPACVKDLQRFLGFTNYYRRFIASYSSITSALTSLLKKDVSFEWGPAQDDAFTALKQAFQKDVLLHHVDESLEFWVEVDASDYAIGAVLSQTIHGSRQPIAFFSRQMQPAERNYAIHDRELLAIVAALSEWRHFLQGSTVPFVVLTDHRSLEYFMSTKQLTRRQARWYLFLSEFNFVLQYRKGSDNIPADSLSRRHDYVPTEESQNILQLLSAPIITSALSSVRAIFSSSLNRYILYEKDWPLLIHDYLLSGEWLTGIPDDLMAQCRQQLPRFTLENDMLMHLSSDKRTKTSYCPSWLRSSVYPRFHDGLGHLKWDSISDLITRRHWWPTLETDVKDYIARCPKCQLDQSTATSHTTPMRPLPPAGLPFERWGLDFVQDLPETKAGNRHIITAIDYATRWVVAKAVKNRDAATVASFLYELMVTYGAPYEILTDRGSAFLAEGLQEFIRLQQIRHMATTPYHPQTNGMVERMHGVLNHSLTTLCEGHPERWDEYLPQTVFSLRVRKHAVTKRSPFYLLFGVEPRLPGDDAPLRIDMAPLDALELLEEDAECQARIFDELGDARGAAYVRSRAQAELMRRRHNLTADPDTNYFKVGDMVKLKHHSRTKFEFDWKGPYHIVDVGHPGTYWLMDPHGRRFDSTVNESDLAPWLASVQSNVSFFYDGTSRSQLAQEVEFSEGGGG